MALGGTLHLLHATGFVRLGAPMVMEEM